MLRRAVFALLLAVLGPHALAQAPTTFAVTASNTVINVGYTGGFEGLCTRIYRGGVPILTNCNTAWTYSDGGLTPDTTYSYCSQFGVLDEVGNWISSYPCGNTASATTFGPPADPASLSASGSGTQINLSWTDRSGNETGFLVERKTGSGGTFAQIASLGANVTSYSNTGLAADTSYFYRVRSTNAYGSSGYTNTASATTVPLAPTGLTATQASGSQVNLAWTDTSSTETGFKVERKSGAGGTYAQIATLGVGVTSYNDMGLASGATYFYRVRDTNASGDSGYSNEASASLAAVLVLAFIEVDHLNTPRAIFDASQQLRWRWDQAEPFGATSPNEDPSSLGTYQVPLRFPGQYADKETSLSQNFLREFDSTLGRYVESDPIGLVGGSNTFLYVAAQPLGSTDIFGLFPFRPPSPANPDEGCGSGPTGPVTPDTFFRRCCDKHDGCYDKCDGPSKDTCDREFFSCMMGQCSGRWVGIRFVCEWIASAVYSEAVRRRGDDSFKRARDKCSKGQCKK